MIALILMLSLVLISNWPYSVSNNVSANIEDQRPLNQKFYDGEEGEGKRQGEGVWVGEGKREEKEKRDLLLWKLRRRFSSENMNFLIFLEPPFVKA